MKGFGVLRRSGLTLRTVSARIPRGDIRTAVLPSVAIFPLLQHTGTPAERLVSPGDRVREGMEIAKVSGSVSASVHASIPGVVTTCRSIVLPNGERSDAVVVKLEGEFERLGKSATPDSEGSTLDAIELLRRIMECGLVSMDSRAVPLHVLWKIPRGTRVEHLIVSALDEEPFLAVESHLSLERTEAVAEGLGVAMKILQPRSVLFAAEQAGDGHAQSTEVARVLEAAAVSAGAKYARATVGNHYPRGEHRALARVVTGQSLPAGSSLTSLGLSVTNVSTLVAVRDAVVGGRPLIERYVTVAGGAITEAATLRVRIGTPIRDLIEECGGFRQIPECVVMGGPFTGSVVYDLDTPVTKSTGAILALTRRETARAERTACISCGRCLTACPEGLNPTRLFKEIEHGQLEDAVQSGLMNCTECGSCSYVCPSRIPLLFGLRWGKQAVWRSGGAE